MCEPASAMAAITLISAGMTAYNQKQQGDATAEAYQRNAQIGMMEARDAAEQGAVAEMRHRTKVKQFAGAQIAAQGASGAVIGEGSFGQVLDQTATLGEEDAQAIRMEAIRKGWGIRTQVEQDIYQGRQAKAMGRAKAMGTILSSAPGVYDRGKAADWW